MIFLPYTDESILRSGRWNGAKRVSFILSRNRFWHYQTVQKTKISYLRARNKRYSYSIIDRAPPF